MSPDLSWIRTRIFFKKNYFANLLRDIRNGKWKSRSTSRSLESWPRMGAGMQS